MWAKVRSVGGFCLFASVYNMHHVLPLSDCSNQAAFKLRLCPCFDSLVGSYRNASWIELDKTKAYLEG